MLFSYILFGEFKSLISILQMFVAKNQKLSKLNDFRLKILNLFILYYLLEYLQLFLMFSQPFKVDFITIN